MQCLYIIIKQRYPNSFVILPYHIKACYANTHIIVITRTNYALSYIKALNCLCTKRLYTFLHLYYATPYYSSIAYAASRWHLDTAIVPLNCSAPSLTLKRFISKNLRLYFKFLCVYNLS